MNSESLEWMIQNQVVRRGIHNHALLNALRAIDRKDFVPAASQSAAYEDRPLPLENGQTISQPYIVALMTEQLKLHSNHHVLEIGTGSAYQTAILAFLSHSVISIELSPALHKAAKLSLEPFKFCNVTLIQGDGKKGWEKQAPYDRIILTAAPQDFPDSLFDQLVEGGIMVAPIGKAGYQTLFKITKTAGKPVKEQICGVRFVPLV
jgi:protein-L-isoaspartate(D-aspartate) O-methyltransferase